MEEAKYREEKKGGEEGEEEGEEEYNPLKIPADWEMARKHALSRRVAREKKDSGEDGEPAETCKCCGYEIEREDLDYCAPVNDLGFLGSGYPLFYNFIIYCIFILFV